MPEYKTKKLDSTQEKCKMDKIREQSIDLTKKMEEISSEPETFDTWTIITDSVSNLNKTDNVEYNNQNRIEILTKNNIVKLNLKYDNELENTDELSDGISIISDSESAGRSSPIPLYSTENNNIDNHEIENKEIEYELPIPQINSNINCESESSSKTILSSDINKIDLRIKKSYQDISHQTDSLPLTEKSKQISIFTTRNISLFFYLSASIAIIAFIGKMKYPEWGGKTLEEELINQRVDDLELQNNLLRAEIDIISKQVQYLNKETEIPTKSFKIDTNQKHNDNKNFGKKDKIKVWPGKGKIERTEIPKEALKMPHNCDQFDVNFEGACMDSEFINNKNKNSDTPSIQFDSKLNSDGIKDKLRNIIVESVEKIIPDAIHENIVNSFKAKEKDINKDANSNGKLKKFDKYNSQNRQQHFTTNDKHNTSNDEIINNNFNEKSEKHKDKIEREQPNKDEISQNKIDDTSPENNIRNKYDSTEKYHNKEYYKKDNYKNEENYYKKNNKYKKNHNDKSDEYIQKKYDKKHNDWHENMMKNREEHRKEHNEKLKSNNWYIDRGTGREEARIFEKDHLKFKNIRRK